MPILGNLIKGAVGIAGSVQLTDKSAQENQQEALKNLLEAAQDTAFGLFYDFKSILQHDNIAEEYRCRVPIHTYESINKRWWKQQQKHPNITWPGKPNFFALSSGTTGKKSKRIPITDEMIEDSRSVGAKTIAHLSHFDLPTEVFESEVLMLGSSVNLRQNDNGFLEGEISGINTYNFPEWYHWFYRPGKEIAAIDDWDCRLAAIVKEAPNWNIGSIAGIPSWVQLMLKAVIKEHKLNTIHDIWPNLAAYSTGGVAFAPFKNGFDKLTRKPLTIIDTYLASEGFFGFTDRPNTTSMRLIADANTYYEFIPFDTHGFNSDGDMLANPTSYTIGEIENEKEYALVISTCSGAWRYTLGDTIKFTDKENLQFRITGRTKFFLNVVGSQLSEEKLNKAVSGVAKNHSTSIDEFSVACVQDQDGTYSHQWILASDGLSAGNESSVAITLDNHLQEVNKNYRVARTKALSGIRVKIISTEIWYNMIGSVSKKGGQVKTPKVVKQKKMNEFLNAIEKLVKLSPHSVE